MEYLDKQRFDYENSQRYDEPDNTIVYLVVTDDTEVVFSSDEKIQATIAYDRECENFENYGSSKVELREIDYSDFKNTTNNKANDKHNIENSTLIEFKEL